MCSMRQQSPSDGCGSWFPTRLCTDHMNSQRRRCQSRYSQLNVMPRRLFGVVKLRIKLQPDQAATGSTCNRINHDFFCNRINCIRINCHTLLHTFKNCNRIHLRAVTGSTCNRIHGVSGYRCSCIRLFLLHAPAKSFRCIRIHRHKKFETGSTVYGKKQNK